MNPVVYFLNKNYWSNIAYPRNSKLPALENLSIKFALIEEWKHIIISVINKEKETLQKVQNKSFFKTSSKLEIKRNFCLQALNLIQLNFNVTNL